MDKGQLWLQTETTEINTSTNIPKRLIGNTWTSDFKKKKKNITQSWSLAWIHHTEPQAKNSKANRFKKGNGLGARSMCGIRCKQEVLMMHIYNDAIDKYYIPHFSFSLLSGQTRQYLKTKVKALAFHGQSLLDM